MTRAIMHISDQSIYFDCDMHAGDHDVCTMLTAYCNVLVARGLETDSEPEIYDHEKGHVRIQLEYPSEATKAVFAAVKTNLEALAKEYSEHFKLY